MNTYFVIYLGSFLLATLFTPGVIWTAHRLRLYDSRGVRKIHRKTIPRIGGTAIFLSTMLLGVLMPLVNNSLGRALGEIRIQFFALLATAALVFLVGLIDDVRGLRARHKLLAQIAAALLLCLSGVRIKSIEIAGICTLHFGWLSFPVSILWIVAITNAMNLIDGLDGLAAGISAIACVTIAVFSVACGQVVMAAIILAILGSLCGFLIFNFNPARIFMGDCGSMFLGFVLASASIACSAKSGTVVGLGLAFLALGVPIFDMAFAILRRYLQGRGLMSPDRSHLHHLLLDMGLRQRHVVVTMYVMTAMAAGAGLLMMLSHGVESILIFACAVLLQVLVFRLVGAVNLRQLLDGLKRKYSDSYKRKQEVESYEEVELYFQQAKTFETWWHAMCFAAEQMDFSRVTLPVTNRDGSRRRLSWQKRTRKSDPARVIEVTVPIKDRRVGPSLRLNVGIAANDSLESAGHRTALLTRLVERYGLNSLSAQESGQLPKTEREQELAVAGSV